MMKSRALGYALRSYVGLIMVWSFMDPSVAEASSINIAPSEVSSSSGKKSPSEIPSSPEGESPPSEVPSSPEEKSLSEVPSSPAENSPVPVHPDKESPSQVPSEAVGSDTLIEVEAAAAAKAREQAIRARARARAARIRAEAQAKAAATEKSREKVIALYTEGEVRSSTADYEGAIEVFTEAIVLAGKAKLQPRIELALRQNLGLVRLRAYKVNRKVGQLLAARQILEHCFLFADKHQIKLRKDEKSFINSLLADIDINISAANRSKELQVGLHENAFDFIDDENLPQDWESMSADYKRNLQQKPEQNDVQILDDRRKRSRAWWIAGVGMGAGVGATGIGLIVYGSTFKNVAEDKIAGMKEGNSMGVLTDESKISLDEYRNQEIKKGNSIMVVGAVTTAIGVAGVIAGAVALSKLARESKYSRMPRRSSTWVPAVSFSGRGVGLGLQGQF